MSLVSELAGADTPPGTWTPTCRIVMDEVEGRRQRIVTSHVDLTIAADGLDETHSRPTLAKADEGVRSRSSSAAPAPRSACRPTSPVTISQLAPARRTHKEFGPEPVPQETLLELFRLARLAPNHHLTQPWRFRVLGPEALARLKDARQSPGCRQLDRAPTLVVVSTALSGEVVQDDEDICAVASAISSSCRATERGLASYWRTPGVLRTARGREAVGSRPGARPRPDPSRPAPGTPRHASAAPCPTVVTLLT